MVRSDYDPAITGESPEEQFPPGGSPVEPDG